MTSQGQRKGSSSTRQGRRRKGIRPVLFHELLDEPHPYPQMSGLHKRIEFIVGCVEIRIEKPEPQREIRDGLEFLFAHGTAGTIGRQEMRIGLIEGIGSHPAEVYIDGHVLPEGHDIVNKPAAAHKIKVKESHGIAVEMKVLGEEIKMTIPGGKC